MVKRSLPIAMLLALAACAPQQPLVRSTTSGYPEETYESTTVEAVRSSIIDGCARKGALVQEANVSQVVCAKTMTGSDAMLAQLALGNAYSTTPELKIRFTMYAVGAGVHVTAQQWAETQMPFGQIKRGDMNSNSQRNGVQQFLSSLYPAKTDGAAPTSPAEAALPAAPSAQPPTTPIASSAGAEPRPVAKPSEFGFEAERLARPQCAALPRAALTAKGPGFEAFSVKCDNGDAISVRCEITGCRILR